MAAASDDSFLGTGWAFPPQFNRGRTGMVSGAADIHQSLLILLSTRPGERIMHPLFGCAIQAMTFESINDTTSTEIEVMVTDAIVRCEARVSVQLVAVHVDDVDSARLNVEVVYQINATNSVHNLVFPFYIAGAAGAQSAPA